MTATQFRWFLGVIIALSLAVTTLDTRYHYMAPHIRYDFWYDEYETMIEGGDWVPEKLAGKDA